MILVLRGAFSQQFSSPLQGFMRLVEPPPRCARSMWPGERAEAMRKYFLSMPSSHLFRRSFPTPSQPLPTPLPACPSPPSWPSERNLQVAHLCQPSGSSGRSAPTRRGRGVGVKGTYSNTRINHLFWVPKWPVQPWSLEIRSSLSDEPPVNNVMGSTFSPGSLKKPSPAMNPDGKVCVATRVPGPVANATPKDPLAAPAGAHE